MIPTKKQAKDYIQGAKRFPLEDGQLEAMLVLHFDISLKKAEEIVSKGGDV